MSTLLRSYLGIVLKSNQADSQHNLAAIGFSIHYRAMVEDAVIRQGRIVPR